VDDPARSARPKGTEQMSKAELAELVTRDSMIGVTKVTLDSKAGSQA